MKWKLNGIQWRLGGLLSGAMILHVLAAMAQDSAPCYFRSDGGVMVASGPLPNRFDSPAALLWRVDLDPGHSTPILCRGKILVTTCRSDSPELAVAALDETTGRTLWRHPVAVPKLERIHTIGSPAMATLACDGQRVYAFFGSHGLICLDLEGKLVWDHPLGPFQDEYGAGSSPILIDGKVILNQDHDKDSFLIALDAATGKTVWKSARPDAVRSYATPQVWRHKGRPELLVAGAIELASYSPATGEKLWWTSGLARIVIPTPVASGDIIYMASWAPGGDPGKRLALDSWPVALDKWDQNHDAKLSRTEINDPEVLDRFFRMDLDQDGVLTQNEWERHAAIFRRAQNALLAIKPGSQGELSQQDVVWKHARGVPYVSSPLLDQGRIWMVKDGGIVTKLNAANGMLLQEERLPGLGSYYASPVAGDNKVYFASENGVLSVVANQEQWQVISSHKFNEKIYATPVPAPGRLLVRTAKALYCFH